MADISPLDNKISDDDELANVLAGVKNEAAALDASAVPAATTDTLASLPPVPPVAPLTPSLDFEQTPAVQVEAPAPVQSFEPAYVSPLPAAAPAPAITTPVASSPELEQLKKETLGELRPLVGKLDLPPEEKFDTLLLIIRSTDDQSLLGPAHDAAKLIVDDARRASALLDIIKEIDYFSAKS